jgi:hypothetical protein
MGGTIILGTLGMQTNIAFVHVQSWGYFEKEIKDEHILNKFFFPFHHNTFNYLLPNKIISPLHMQAFIEYKLIHLQILHKKFNMQQINNENHAKFIHS